MNSWRWLVALLTASGALAVASMAQAQTCSTDEDCAEFSVTCIDAVCSLPSGLCIADPHPPDTPCPTVACRDAFCDGNGACVDADPHPLGTPCTTHPCTDGLCDGSGTCGDQSQSAPGTPCDDLTYCTVNDSCDNSGLCTQSDRNPDPACNLYQCPICTTASCNEELLACLPAPACEAFASCFSTCTKGTCINACAGAHPSPETDALFACMADQCAAECFPPSILPALDVRLHLLLATLIFVSGWALFTYTRPSR